MAVLTWGYLDQHRADGSTEFDPHYGEAQAQFEKCLAAEPDDADCHWEIGWAFWMHELAHGSGK